MCFQFNLSLHHHSGVKWNIKKKSHGREENSRGSKSHSNILFRSHNNKAWLVTLGSQENHHGFKMSLKILGMILEEKEEAMEGKVEYKIGSTMDRIKVINHSSKQGWSYMGTKGGHGPCQLSKRNPIVGRSVCVVQRERERQQRSALPRRLTHPFPSPEAVNWTSSSSLLLMGLHQLLLISSSSSSYFFSFFFQFPNPSILLFVFPSSTFCLSQVIHNFFFFF